MKTVWILGAGASASHSSGHFPTLLGLPLATQRLRVIERDAYKSVAYRYLVDYLNERGFSTFDAPVELNVERVLTALEIDLTVSPRPALLVAHDLVLRILRVTIKELQNETWNSSGEYDRLAASLRRSDSVITFNWDCLLDDVLKRREMLADIDVAAKRFPTIQANTPYGDFLLRFSAWGETTIHGLALPSPVRDIPADRGMFIKAHGSIDWFYCRNPMCRSQGKVFPMPDYDTSQLRCSGCLEETAVLIVPPTLNKRLREIPMVSRLWSYAANEVRQATELIIWGYSLPPTDFFSEWMLRNVQPGGLERVTVINKSAELSGDPVRRLSEDFAHHFRSVFSHSLTTTHRFFATFADYEAGAELHG